MSERCGGIEFRPILLTADHPINQYHGVLQCLRSLFMVELQDDRVAALTSDESLVPLFVPRAG